MQRTGLYDWHASHGGRMVEFAGWNMPVQYASIVEEHNAVRQAAGLFDISHMGRLSFAGNDVLKLLERIDSNDVASMKEMQVRYGLVCNDQGGIRDDILVYRWPYGFAMVVNASNREKILVWLEESRQGLDVQVHDQTLSTCMIALQGPKSLELSAGLFADDVTEIPYYFARPTRYADKPCVVSRTGYTGEDGFEFMLGKELGNQLWEELVCRGAKPCGLGARDTLRLEAGMPLYGHELSEEIDPLQAGLSWAVKLGKGDFRGRSALLEKQHDTLQRRRIGLKLHGRRIAREGAEVRVAGKAVGVVTSGTFSPTFQQPIAMAYLDPEFTKPGQALQVDVRGTEEEAVVTALPFYRRKKG